MQPDNVNGANVLLDFEPIKAALYVTLWVYNCNATVCAICKCSLTLYQLAVRYLTHWGRVTHIYVGKLTYIGSDNGLSPERRQAIVRTNAGILLIGPLGINVSEILIEVIIFSFNKMHLKMSSAKWRSFRLGLNVLISYQSSLTSSSVHDGIQVNVQVTLPKIQPNSNICRFCQVNHSVTRVQLIAKLNKDNAGKFDLGKSHNQYIVLAKQ